MGVLHPVLGEALAIIEVAVMLTIIGTALFGSQTLSVPSAFCAGSETDPSRRGRGGAEQRPSVRR
jgi:hypothetical protein